MSLIILSFYDSFLAKQVQSSRNLHRMCSVYYIFLFFYFYLVSSTLLEEESINVILETSVGQVHLRVCWSVTLSKQKDLLSQKHACGMKRLNLTL